MRLFVLHQNFPGQFGHLVRAWCRRPGWDVRALGRDTAPGLPGFNLLTRYKLARSPHAHQHPYLRTMESAVLHGQAVARVLLDMKTRGFTPDTLLGGAGSDKYVFSGEFGRDLIVDADASGSIEYNGGALAQGLKVFDGLWQSSDRTVTYTRVSAGSNADGSPRYDLVVSFADSAKRIVIRDWNEGSRNLGVTFGGNFALPATMRNVGGNSANSFTFRSAA